MDLDRDGISQCRSRSPTLPLPLPRRLPSLPLSSVREEDEEPRTSDCKCWMLAPPPMAKFPCVAPTTPETGVGKGIGDLPSLADEPGAGDKRVRMLEISGSFVPALGGPPVVALIEPGGVGILMCLEDVLLPPLVDPKPAGVLEGA